MAEEKVTEQYLVALWLYEVSKRMANHIAQRHCWEIIQRMNKSSMDNLFPDQPTPLRWGEKNAEAK